MFEGDTSSTNRLHGEAGDTIIARFDRLADRFSDQTALVSERWRLTYAELRAAANAWARVIADAAGSPGDRAVLCMRHDAPLVAAVLAALKAGRIAVVLNPTDPPARTTIQVQPQGKERIRIGLTAAQ